MAKPKMQTVRVGNRDINVAALDGWTKTQFKKHYKGKLSIDLEKGWEIVEADRKARKEAVKAAKDVVETEKVNSKPAKEESSDESGS